MKLDSILSKPLVVEFAPPSKKGDANKGQDDLTKRILNDVKDKNSAIATP